MGAGRDEVGLAPEPGVDGGGLVEESYFVNGDAVVSAGERLR